MEFRSSKLRTTRLAMRLMVLCAIGLLFAVAAQAQSSSALPKAPSDPKDDSKDDPRFGSPEMEMRSKLEIKEEKRKYDEHVARAKEASQLAAQISTSYESRNGFSSDDQKRLDRLEKLFKRIRNDAGGGNDNDDGDMKDIPAGMAQTLRKIAAMAEELNKLVEHTPRNVVSAAVIDQANKLLGIVQHIRAGR